MGLAIAEQVRGLVGTKVDGLEEALLEHLDGPAVLKESAASVLESGGKRLRPYLHLVAAELCGYRGEDDILFASLIEYVHVASLLHDDVIDDSLLRRGRPTLNQKLGNTLTVLVGDYLCMKAQAMALQQGSPAVARLVSGTTLALVAGEALQEAARGRLDLGEDEYFEIVELKTGRLMAAACAGAGLLAGEDEGSPRVARLAEYGALIGRAFQLTDDILDFESDEDTLGKPVLADLREGTLTLPVIHALRSGGDEAHELIESAVSTACADADTVQAVLSLVRESGGIDVARERAAEAAADAREALSCFPDGLARQALQFATEFSVQRRF
ncbi:MAG: polyprenyl synthetase family protein [Acidobacteriota bacterium]